MRSKSTQTQTARTLTLAAASPGPALACPVPSQPGLSWSDRHGAFLVCVADLWRAGMAAWDEMEECLSARCNWEWSMRSEAERSDMGRGGGPVLFPQLLGEGVRWWLEALQGRAGEHLGVGRACVLFSSTSALCNCPGVDFETPGLVSAGAAYCVLQQTTGSQYCLQLGR